MWFINLRNYSENSILNAPLRIADLINKAVENKQKAVALTDKSAYWMITFYKECLNNKIKPIFWLNSKTSNWLHNLIMFSKSEIWKINMFNLATDFWTEKSISLNTYKDDKEKLEDVIFIIDYNSYSKFPLYDELFHNNIIKKENLYIELQPRNTETDFQDAIKLVGLDNIIITSPTYYINKEDYENLVLMKSIETWKLLGDINVNNYEWFYFKTESEIRSDFNYITDEQFDQIVNNIEKIVNDVNFELDLETYQIPFFQIEWEQWEIYQQNETYLKATKSDEWYLRYLAYTNLWYRYKEISEEFNVNKEIALLLSHKEFDIQLEKSLSQYSIPELKELSKQHWSKEKKEWYEKSSQIVKDYIDRIEYEFFVIHKMWFNSYLLMVSDYIIWARNNGDQVWPWRGSAAWSIVTFLTWITDIDPIKWDLLFERFLNSARLSMPDIDTDFSNRDAVIAYAIEKYWEDKVTPIITFWKLTSRTVLKWIWKALGIWFAEMNRLTNLITDKEATWHVPLEKIYASNENFREAVDKSNEIKNVYNKAIKLENFKQWTWTHACAVIIAPKQMTDYMPLQYPVNKQWVLDKTWTFVTQLEWPDAEALWLLKMDFLWLNNLTIINDCLKLIKKHKNITENMTKVDVTLDKVYEKIFHTWRTTNVFQFESDWMKKYLKWLKPNNLEDLIAMVSLYRPWPLEFIPSFINRKHWIEDIKYMTDDLRKTLLANGHSEQVIEEQKLLLEKHLKWILDVSYWVAVYQEQLMFMAQYMAWFSLWEADLLRRAIWKKKIKIIKEQREVFIEKAKTLGYLEEVTGYVYDATILPAANYSFNKSHAACYAFIAYQWAYLKTYYPAEYLVAILMTQWTDLVRTKIAIEDALIDWIKIVPLDINISEVEYKYISDTQISLGLKLIKGVWEWDLQKVIDERDRNWKYISFDDFIQRNKKILNKKILSWLLTSWALDTLIEQNKWIINIDKILNFVKKEKKTPSNQVNLFSLFDNLDDNDNGSNLIELEDPQQVSNAMSRAINEIENTWLMLKNHPFDWIKTFIENFELNRDTLHWNKNSALLKSNELEIRGVWIIMDIRSTKTGAWKTLTNMKLLWTDYYISAMIWSDLTHQYEYELIWTSKDKPSWIYKMIEYTWKFSINEYGRSLFISELKFKDINQAYNVAKNQWKYKEDDKCSWSDIYLYKNEVLDYKKMASILISEYLLKPENINDYNEKMKDLKEFLLKHHSNSWEYDIVLKTYDGRIKETWLSITNKDALINYIEKTGWLKIVWVKRSSES